MLEKDIAKTIKYCQKYKCLPKREQLSERLISSRLYTKEEIINCLKKNNYQSDFNSLADKSCREKISLAKDLINKLKVNKNIVFIGITGSVATGYPNPKDDIDLLVISKRNKLWITRFWIKIFLIKNKIAHRKYGDEEKENFFCFNLWLDESKLELPKEKQTLKNAMDLILMKPIFNRDYTYEKFIMANSWVKCYVINGYNQLFKKLVFKNIERQNGFNLIDSVVNYFFYKLQFNYMKSKLKKEYVSLKQAFFHPNG